MWQQIRAITWAQFRIARNHLPRTSVGSVLMWMLSLFWYGIYAAVAIVFVVAGTVLFTAFLLIRWTRKLYQGLPMVLLIGMLVWAMFDFARASAVTEGNPP